MQKIKPFQSLTGLTVVCGAPKSGKSIVAQQALRAGLVVLDNDGPLDDCVEALARLSEIRPVLATALQHKTPPKEMLGTSRIAALADSMWVVSLCDEGILMTNTQSRSKLLDPILVSLPLQ